MAILRTARYQARYAQNRADVLSAQRLRHQAFLVGNNGNEISDELDQDAFDPICRHILVEEINTGVLVCCFRLLPLISGVQIGQSYSAQYYGLAKLKTYKGPMAEIGRFCIDQQHRHPDILRLAWASLTRFVDQHEIKLLFGCTSFQGIKAKRYQDAFDELFHKHIAPDQWLPDVISPNVVPFGRNSSRLPYKNNALHELPPLLRSYLAIGGWVSDHAVVDENLDTLHVFTGLEIRRIPARRVKTLRAMAG